MELLTPLLKDLPANASEELVIRIGKDICNALVLCQKHEIVHSNIKPQNIFVSANGDYKLGDSEIAEGDTKAGTYKYYMAPEVYNNEPYGSAADVYSLGLVLYWLLNMRRMPFEPLPPEILTAEQEEKAWLRRVSGEKMYAPIYGSNGLKRIILKSCAYAPGDRYTSAAEMLEDLQKLEKSQSIAESVFSNVAVAAMAVTGSGDRETVCCTGCGAILTRQKNFCTNCGKAVEAEAKPVETDPNATARVTRDTPVSKRFCTGCGAELKEHQRFCTGCGKNVAAAIPELEQPQPPAEDQSEKGKGKGLFLKIALGVLVLLILGAVAYLVFFSGSGDNASKKKASDDGEETTSAQACEHRWENATCKSPATCSVCKETTGEMGDHQWTAATCASPKQCSVCGITEGEKGNHRWTAATKTQPATCSVCGATSGTRILPTLRVTNLYWKGGARPQCICEGAEATISASDLADFSSSEITVIMPNGQAVSQSEFDFVREADAIKIVFKETVAEGGYNFVFRCASGEVQLSLCYGYAGEIYLEHNNLDWVNRKFQNWQTKGYLVQSAAGLETTNASASASAFVGRKQMCGIAVGADGYAYPVANGDMITITTRAYTLHGGTELWVFTYDGWYMAADTSGRVFFTKTLTNECYWSCVF